MNKEKSGWWVFQFILVLQFQYLDLTLLQRRQEKCFGHWTTETWMQEVLQRSSGGHHVGHQRSSCGYLQLVGLGQRGWAQPLCLPAWCGQSFPRALSRASSLAGTALVVLVLPGREGGYWGLVGKIGSSWDSIATEQCCQCHGLNRAAGAPSMWLGLGELLACAFLLESCLCQGTSLCDLLGGGLQLVA